MKLKSRIINASAALGLVAAIGGLSKSYEEYVEANEKYAMNKDEIKFCSRIEMGLHSVEAFSLRDKQERESYFEKLDMYIAKCEDPVYLKRINKERHTREGGVCYLLLSLFAGGVAIWGTRKSIRQFIEEK
ncbi:MAG: hypothetical protein ABIB71_00710 [Candidatus Woesearchaeota archaeon]